MGKPADKETLNFFVKKAINLLLTKQVSETLILSSYKINTMLRNYFGKTYKIDRIGRALSRIAKQRKLNRLTTKIPKYEVRVSQFTPFKV